MENLIDREPWYTAPTQCIFWSGNEWCSGIVFNDYVINATTGEVKMNAECAAAAVKEDFDDWIIEYDWVDLTQQYINSRINYNSISKLKQKI